MVLSQLSGSIQGALARMCKATVVDEKLMLLNDCVNDISRALRQADVRFETVRGVQASIKSTVNLQALADGTNKRRVIHRAVVAELRRMLDPGPGKPSFTPSKGRKPASVVMFVGLQGSGKTTTCVKYADYHRRMKGFRPALVKRYMTMMDSMTDAELDGTSPKLMNQSRINRVARGSGRPVRDVVGVLEEHRRMAKMMSKLPNVRRPNDINHIINAIPQDLLNRFGGKFGLQNLIRQMAAQS